MSRAIPGDFGWCPDLADHRDYTLRRESVVTLLGKLNIRTRKPRRLPESVDWREYCGPISDQLQLPTGSAHACVAMVQFFERRSSGRLADLSRLFVHAVARRFALGLAQPALSLRPVLKAAVRCGIPPEKYWPYQLANLNRDPDAFAYSFQREFRALRYLRLDDHELTATQILDRLRAFLAAGFPIAFGFPVCSSIGDTEDIPFPVATDAILGGQALLAVGYDDARRIRSDKGALLVRNSWGSAWGDQGYGWLPYSYVRSRLAVDFWTLLKPSWLRTGEFEMPA